MLDLTSFGHFAWWMLLFASFYIAALGTGVWGIIRPPFPRQIFYAAAAGGFTLASLF